MIGPFDLSKELWREYQFGAVVYQIDAPLKAWLGTTTHRILDSEGIVHCVPRPGLDGCVLRWKPRDANNPVQF